MKGLALILSLALCGLALADEAFTLKHEAKKGEVVKYKLTSTSTSNMGTAEIGGTVTGTTTKVADDAGYMVEEKMDLKITFPGGEMPIASTQTMTYGPDDLLRAIEGDQVDDATREIGFKSEALRAFHRPDKAVKVGDNWTFLAAADSHNGSTSTKVDYKVVGSEELMGHKVLKVHVVGSQGSGKIEGDDWIDQSSGLLIKAEGNITGVEMAPGITGDSKYTLVIVE